MFKSLIRGIVISVLSLAMFVSAIPMVSARADGDTVEVYRLYNATTKRYLYTTDKGEVLYQVQKKGWRYDGVAWNAPTEGTQIFRIFRIKTNIHVYTSDQTEIDYQIKNNGFQMDRDGKEMFFSGGTVKVARFFNNKTGAHFFTTDARELANLRADTATWREEEGFYAVSPGDIKVPVGEIVLPANARTIENTDSYYAIEADMTVKGSGTGYHAKILVVTPDSGVSFGIQHDQFARAPYTGIPYFMSENIYSNAIGVPGEQHYAWHKKATIGETYKVLLTLDRAGNCAFYVNGEKVGSAYNPKLAGRKDLYLRCEGSARLNGDSVNVTFRNIKLKGKDGYNPDKKWGIHSFDTNKTMKSTFPDATKGIIAGYITGLGPGQDWDNAYGAVSGIMQFVE